MKRYIVTQNQPTRFGLIERKHEWKFIFDTDNLKTANRGKQNWQQFAGYKTIIIDSWKAVIN